MLRLLALIVQGLGGAGLDQYEAPSEWLAGRLTTVPDAGPGRAARRLERRRAEVAAFISAAGGELA